jgi:glycerol-3-phosphate dehydrogenase
LVFDAKRISNRDAVVITEGSRVLFVLPWGERTIVGTTDTDYQGRPEDVRTTAADVDYLLKTLNRFFPGARLTEADIISSYSGLRPLIADPHGKPSDISRSHQILNPSKGWWDVAGGKLTTYRLMAEQTVDRIAQFLGETFKECRTAEMDLLPREEIEGISQITPPAVSRELVDHFCRNEFATHLDDIMMRRSSWHYYEYNAAGAARQVADWAGEILGWNDSKKEQEYSRYAYMSDCPLTR